MKIGLNSRYLEHQRFFTSFLIPVIILFFLISYSWWYFGTGNISVHISSSAQGTKFKVGDKTINITESFPIHRINLIGWDGAFPQRIKKLAWGEDKIEALSSKAYDFRAVRKGESYNTGDWWSDNAGSFYYISTPVRLENNPWVLLEFTMRSLRGIKLELYGEGKQVLAIHIRRGLINSDIFVSKDEQVISSGEYFASPVDSIISLIAPIISGALGAMLLWWIASSKLLSSELRLRIPTLDKKTPALLIGIFALVTFAVAKLVLDGIPHFQDDLGYLIRAKWLLHGKLTGSIDDFNLIGDIPHTYLFDGVVKSIYTIGWPFVLSIGELIKLPWLISPLLGILSALLIYKNTCKIWGRNAAIFSLLFFTTSPIVIILSSSLLAHSCCAFFILLHQTSLFCWRENKSKVLYLIISGLSLGFAFTIRPLTAIALTIPAALFFLCDLVSFPNRIRLISNIFIMGVFGVIGTLPVWIDNYLVNSSPWIFSYEQGMGHHFGVVSWDKAFSLASATASLLTTNIFGWGGGAVPAWLGGLFTYSLALIPFIGFFQKDRKPIPDIVWYSWIGLFSLIALYIGHDASGMHGYGPRFYYEAIPLILISSGIGAAMLIEKSNHLVTRSSVSLFAVIFSILIVILPAINLPSRLERLKGYNGIRLSSSANIHKDGEIIFANSWYQLVSLMKYTCFLNCSLDKPLVTLKSWDEIQALKNKEKIPESES